MLKICLYITLLGTFLIQDIKATERNTCKDYLSYYCINYCNSCYYEPDVFATTPNILARHTERYESYNVTTTDGYILTLFRIPKENAKGVVILHHPVGTDSIIWVGQSNASLAFLMSEAGYDVWLPNNRGTFYCEEHKELSANDVEFWDFSYHEVGMYDMPANINFIKSKTNRSDIIFIGHSMATSASIAFASLQPNVAKGSIKIFIEMSPVAYFNHVRSPGKYISPFAAVIKKIFALFGIGYLWRYNGPSGFVLRILERLPLKRLVVIVLNFFIGWAPDQFEPSLINLFLTQNPRGVSWKLVNHYSQQVNAGGRYQMYDYGKEKNMQLYKSEEPPEYPVENINVPMYLIASTKDSCATVEDTELLYSKLSKEAKIYGWYKRTDLNHFDFHYGKDRNTLYDHIFNLLDKI